ncbi:HEAT repeat domain-containing protein [Okeania sp.]|uniref:HEAT repeat domain-containing protein n=1 Tax=Okeania sp. TaxID=3100323 RepID=UPI002B4B1CD1|nr:HEAT repeat domain-containing protein [Okeania sp.]MEB3340796.1 HEAT repeat domain-containing protein [Okeania sp.]
MNPTTIQIALAAVLATKALEKTGENIDEVVWNQSAKFIESLKQQSPNTVTAIEKSSEQPLNYRQVVLQILGAVTNRNVAQTIQELAAAVEENPHPKINQVLQEIEKILNFQQQTKAQLYSQLVEEFYHSQSDRFPIHKTRRQELEKALGELAKQNIDSNSDRSPLQKNLIEQILGVADDENSLFDVALQIGWLNNVQVAAGSPTEKVYAFFHPRFEEYFAAIAINNCNFFFPPPENNKPVKLERYRIFQPQWKQVILLWLGREDLEEEKKEEFIKALTKFKDRYGDFLIQTGKKIYTYQAYFLAAAGVVEFPQCSQTDKIVNTVVYWACNHRLKEIETKAQRILLETPRKKTINALVKLLGYTSDNKTRTQAAESLGKIGTGNEYAIDSLVNLLQSTPNRWTRNQVAESLGKIGTGNEKAINSLVYLLKSTFDDTRRKAAETLGKIDPGNQKAIDSLVQLLESTSNNQIRRQAAETLGKIDPGNQKAIDSLVQLLESTSDDKTRRQAAYSLEKIGMGNEKAIDGLLQLLESTSDDSTRLITTYSLGKIGIGNQKAIDSLANLLKSSSDKYIRWGVGESLRKIDPGNQTAIDSFAYLPGSTSDHTGFRAKKHRWLFLLLCFLLGIALVLTLPLIF